MNFKFKYFETLTLKLKERRVLRRASVYQTVSMSAVLVINGVILTVFFLPKSGAVYLKKTKAGKEIASYEERYHALERW